MDPLSVLGGTAEAVNGAAQQAQPEQPQQQMAPGIAPTQTFENERPKSMWHQMVVGALTGLASSGGARSFGAGLGAGAKGVFDQEEAIRFRNERAALSASVAARNNLEMSRLKQEARYAADDHAMQLVDFYAKRFGYVPSWVSDDDSESGMAGLKHLSKTNEGGVPPVFTMSIGNAGPKGKLVAFTLPPPDQQLEFVNYARQASNVPKLSEAQWKGLNADKQEQYVHDANDLWMPSEITEEKIPGLIARYKGMKDTLLQRADTAPEFRTEVAAKFDSAIEMLTKIQADHTTRKIDYKKKEVELTESAKVRAEDRADARRRRNSDEPSMRDANTLRDDYNRDLKQLEWPSIQGSMARIQSSGKDASPAGDLALIYNFVKMLDPGSVTRESEFAIAANAAPLLDRYGLEKYSRVWKGERLTQGQRDDLVKRARGIFNEIKTQKGEIDSLYRGRAQRYNIPADDILSPDLSTGEDKQSGFSVTDPRGTVHNFRSQQEADAFKNAMAAAQQKAGR
jgi:hypothetical protein